MPPTQRAAAPPPPHAQPQLQGPHPPCTIPALDPLHTTVLPFRPDLKHISSASLTPLIWTPAVQGTPLSLPAVHHPVHVLILSISLLLPNSALPLQEPLLIHSAKAAPVPVLVPPLTCAIGIVGGNRDFE